MTRTWADVDRLFEDLLDVAPEHRSRELERMCGGDVKLRDRLSRLLAEAAEIEPFMSDPGAAIPPSFWDDLGIETSRDDSPGGGSRDEPLPPGTRIGDYELVRRLGRGGMGTVFLAERSDGVFRQKVAIKLLRRGLDTEDVVARFETERQILASLRHPNIARLIDGGASPDGRPYLVMDYVEGVRIDHFCSERDADLETRLRLFLAVVSAVQHAHQNLVVHRDIKPGNILVTAEGDPKLLDFGIAKLLDATSIPATSPRTRAGLNLLTPEYASPEQREGGPVTTGSDVYQLGLLLHHLAAGQKPDTGGSDGRLRTATTGELDAIVRKALRPEPERRYETAAALADDVVRLLEGRPVSARPDRWHYRTRKFLQRNRWFAPVAALLALGAVGYAATLVRHQRALEDERNLARAEAEKATRMRDFLAEIFTAADPARELRGGDEVTARELLERGAVRARTELGDQPDVQAELLATIAGVQHEIGLYAEALPVAEEALELYREVEGDPSAQVARQELLLALLANKLGWSDGAARFDTALAAATAAFGPNHPFVAEVLITKASETRPPLSYEETRPLFDRAIEILRAAGAAEQELLADALVRSVYGSPDPDDIERMEEALRIRQEVHGPDHPAVAAALSDIALTLDSHGQPGADSVMREAVRVHVAAVGERDPTSLTLMSNLAGILRTTDQYGEAEALYRRVLAIRQVDIPDNPEGIAYARYGLGYVLLRQDRPEEAEETLVLAAGAFDDGDFRRELVLLEVGRAVMEQGRFDEAEDILLRCRRNLGDLGHPAQEDADRALAELYDRRGPAASSSLLPSPSASRR